MKTPTRRLRELLAAFRNQLERLLADLRAADRKVLLMVMSANVAGVAHGFLMAAVGVTENVGPVTAALIGVIFGTPVFWYHFRPSLRGRWSVWRPSLLWGIALGANNVAYQLGLRWVRLQLLQPLSFLFTAIFMVGPAAWRDARGGRYSTFVWPILAVLGIWMLAVDTVGGTGGGGFSAEIPQVHVLGRALPGWILAVGCMVVAAATYAFHNRQMETLDGTISGKVNTLAGIPAFAILAVGAWTLEGGWSGMTDGFWPYLPICAGSAMLLALLSGVVMVKAYGEGLRASTTAMLLPLRTLLGTCLGMAVAQMAPGPLGLAAIVLILVASCGATVIQSRKDGADLASSDDRP